MLRWGCGYVSQECFSKGSDHFTLPFSTLESCICSSYLTAPGIVHHSDVSYFVFVVCFFLHIMQMEDVCFYVTRPMVLFDFF